MDGWAQAQLEGVGYHFQEARLAEGEALRGGVALLDGLRGHETHGFLCGRLCGERCSVLSFDLLGGEPPGKSCSVADFHQQALPVWRALAAALDKHFPKEAPVALLGCSYGFTLMALGLAALDRQVFQQLQSRAQLVVGLAPALKIAPAPSLLSFLSGKGAVKEAAAALAPPQALETDPRLFKGRPSHQQAQRLAAAGQEALRQLPKIALPFLLLFGSEDYALPPTATELAPREDLDIRLLKGGKEGLFKGDDLLSGRALEATLSALGKLGANDR